MKKRVILFVLIAAPVCLLCPVIIAAAHSAKQARQQTANKPATLRERLQQQLNEWHAAGKFPGASIGVALSDGTSFGLTVGYADTATKQSLKPDNLLLQGSVGKTYVSAVALQLVAEGKLKLDDKIEKWLGQEKWFARLPNARDITLRMLLNHTSGLVRYEFKEQFAADLTRQPDKVWRPEELIAYILDTTAPFPAGKDWEYSDTNYIVLGMIIERVTNSTYYQELRKRILEPLGLRQTVPSDSRSINGLVQGYAGADNPFGKSDAMIVNGSMIINPQFEWTGGGIASSATDLARWAKLLYEGRATSPALLREMLNGVPAKLGPESKYGLGVIIRPTPLGPSYGHSGFFPGYLTDVMYFPQHRVAIAMQVNTSVPRATVKPLSRVLVELAETVVAEQARADEAAVTNVVKRLFDTMQARQGEELRGLFLPEGRLVSTQTRQGQPTTRYLSRDEFVKMTIETKEPFLERMFEPEVRVQGDMATVWGRYDFHVGERLTNCGFNSVQLLRTPEGWKIINIASTILTVGCNQTK
ncbi:MAG: serine hydrolase [Pyrinomonadaceae bacterium]|nr:serine hydrolase [Pyrinomonadaceae bacterium]